MKLWKWRHLQAIIAVLILTLTQVSSHLCADDRIGEINERIAKEELELASVAAREKELTSRLTSLRRKLDGLTREEQKLSNKLQVISAQKVSLESEHARGTRELGALKLRFKARLQALYKCTSQSSASVILLNSSTVEGNADIRRLGLYLARVRNSDSQLFSRWQQLSSDHSKRLKEMQKLAAEQGQLLRNVSSQRAEVRTQTAAVEELAVRSRDERRRRETLVSSLRAQALRLETVVSSLTGSGLASGARREPINRVPSDRETRGESFLGAGLESVRRSLVFPAEGQVIKRFGDRRESTYLEAPLSRGIYYLIPPGGTVRAISRGKVAYRGAMGILGNILIVDHGDRYYSLYGKLSNIRPATGDVVDVGEPIATVGAAISEGANFYFEVRRHGAPVDPERVFGKRFQ